MVSSPFGGASAQLSGRKVGFMGRRSMAMDSVDPEEKVPVLPMPFRMIDKIIRGLVEEALEQARDEKDDDDIALPMLDPVFNLDTVKDATCLQSTDDGLFMLVGTEAGQIQVVNTLRGAVASKVDVGEDPIKALAIAMKGTWLATAAGAKVAVHSVVKSPPFLKAAHEIPLKEQATHVHMSEDGKVVLAVNSAGQMEAFALAIPPPQLEVEEEEEDEEAAEAALDQKAAEEGTEPPPLPDPAPVLLAATSTDADGQPRTPQVFFCFSPKSRDVGETAAKEVRNVLVVYCGTSVFYKFTLKPREAEDESLQAPSVTLRTPSPISTAAMDTSTAFLCTGMDNGTLLIWNNIFNTQHFCLKRHKGRVTGSVFKETSTPFPHLITCAADSLRLYDMKDGSLLKTFSSIHLSPLRVIPSEIPLAIVEGTDGSLHLFNTESHSLAASLKLPQDFVALTTPTNGSTLGEVLGVVREKKTATALEGEEEEEEGEEEGEAKRGDAAVSVFRLIDMLKLAYPQMVKGQVSQFIQASGREAYWKESMPQNPAVSDRFFRDAQQASSQMGGTPSSFASNKAAEFASPRRFSNSPRANPPLQAISPSNKRGGALPAAPSPGLKARDNASSSGTPGSRRSRRSSREGSNIGAGLAALMQVDVQPSLAETSVFDPVDAVMQEMRVRQEEKLLRRVHRQKRTAELLASV